MNRRELSVRVSNFLSFRTTGVRRHPARVVSSTVAHARQLAKEEGVSLSALFSAVLHILAERYRGIGASKWCAGRTLQDVLQQVASPDNNPSGTKLRVTFDWTDQPITLKDLCIPELNLNLFVNELTGDAEGNWQSNYTAGEPWDDVESIDRHFAALLKSLITSPDSDVSVIPYLSTEESRSILTEWNQNETAFPQEISVDQLFSIEAHAHPERTAIVCDCSQLTYGQIEADAVALATKLRCIAPQSGSIIVVALDRSPHLIISTLAVLKAGACYLPVDPLSPAEWLRMVGEDTTPVAIITKSAYRACAEAIGAPVIYLDDETENQPIVESKTPLATSGDPAYIIYTSGSTGVPKGIQVSHRSIIRLVRNTDYIDLKPSDVIAQLANATFDAFTFEVWGALLNGGSVAIIPSEVVFDPEALAATIQQQGITVMFLTTALFNLVARLKPDAFRPLRVLLMGGEAATPAYQRCVMQAGPPQIMLHVYGPTECTTFSLWHQINDVPLDAASIPLGRPLANMQAYILDQALQPVAYGVEGELCLAGEGLAIGYFRRPELTAERFIAIPAAIANTAQIRSDGRMYKTGDRVRQTRTGDIEFLGRTDNQIKLRGFRIELEEIEAALRGHPSVAEAIVKVRADTRGEKHLAAYVESRGLAKPSEWEMKHYLRGRLQEYMIPQSISVLEQLPLNSSGKIDRHAEYPDPLAAITAVAPESDAENQIAEIWKGILLRETLGLDENFFDLGATSLDLAVAHAAIEDRYHAGLRVTDLFRYSTIRVLAHRVQKVPEAASAESDARIRAARQVGAFAGHKKAAQGSLKIARAATAGTGAGGVYPNE